MQSEFHLRPIAYRPLGRAGLFVNAKPLVFGMGVATPITSPPNTRREDKKEPSTSYILNIRI